MYVPDIEQHDIQLATKNINAMGTMTKEELNAEIFNKLSHRHKARAVYKRMDYNLLCWTKELLEEFIQEKDAEIARQHEKNENRQQVISAMEALLADHDFTLHELYPDGIGSPDKKPARKKRSDNVGEDGQPKKKKPRQVTYKFTCEIFDQTYYWSGTGYLPKPLRCHLAKGHTIESCLMDPDDWIVTTQRMSNEIPDEYLQISEQLWATAEREGIAKNRSDLPLMDLKVQK